jgi:hypothetical protein
MTREIMKVFGDKIRKETASPTMKETANPIMKETKRKIMKGTTSKIMKGTMTKMKKGIASPFLTRLAKVMKIAGRVTSPTARTWGQLLGIIRRVVQKHPVQRTSQNLPRHQVHQNQVHQREASA